MALCLIWFVCLVIFWSVCFYFIMLLFILDACFILMCDIWGSGEDMGGTEEGGSVIRIN